MGSLDVLSVAQFKVKVKLLLSIVSACMILLYAVKILMS
jgi:hypothetical protein